ncbi:hypothetical protein Pmani_029681 [Petrolisthes manimaculis]|uniref:Uncharacterized protein n=1 Tax=Petrolisthes manimaculis TaxID=1843537 RepID=A0AAE1NY94_9EUCA|nr:hypothetical protein Pmani_029681 [Petrolisthes manimaculis]
MSRGFQWRRRPQLLQVVLLLSWAGQKNQHSLCHPLHLNTHSVIYYISTLTLIHSISTLILIHSVIHYISTLTVIHYIQHSLCHPLHLNTPSSL